MDSSKYNRLLLILSILLAGVTLLLIVIFISFLIKIDVLSTSNSFPFIVVNSVDTSNTVTEPVASSTPQNQVSSTLPPTLTAKSLENTSTLPPETPTLTVTSTTTVTVENLVSCKNGGSVACVFAFGNLENSQGLITLKLLTQDRPLISVKVENDVFSCRSLEVFPDRLYCIGPRLPEGKKVTIFLLGENSTPIAKGDFFIPVSTPTPAPPPPSSPGSPPSPPSLPSPPPVQYP